MVLLAEIEKAKSYMAELEIDIKTYTQNISLPIKERMYAQWEYLKFFVKNIEEEVNPPKKEPVKPVK